MDSGFPYFDIIFFAMVAAFLVLRLRSVLGRRTGHEQQQPGPDRYRGPAPGPAGEASDNVVALPRSDKPEAGALAGPVERGVARIRGADPSFDPDGFVQGARSAFELILNAFAVGDRDTLRPLTSDEVFGAMDGAIAERERQGHVLDATLVGIKSAEIVEAELEGREAHVTVRFVSEQVNVTRDAEGQTITGSPNVVEELTDVWTFVRDTRARDPNWKLTATRSPH